MGITITHTYKLGGPKGQQTCVRERHKDVELYRRNTELVAKAEKLADTLETAAEQLLEDSGLDVTNRDAGIDLTEVKTRVDIPIIPSPRYAWSSSASAKISRGSIFTGPVSLAINYQVYSDRLEEAGLFRATLAGLRGFVAHEIGHLVLRGAKTQDITPDAELAINLPMGRRVIFPIGLILFGTELIDELMADAIALHLLPYEDSQTEVAASLGSLRTNSVRGYICELQEIGEIGGAVSSLAISRRLNEYIRDIALLRHLNGGQDTEESKELLETLDLTPELIAKSIDPCVKFFDGVRVEMISLG